MGTLKKLGGGSSSALLSRQTPPRFLYPYSGPGKSRPIHAGFNPQSSHQIERCFSGHVPAQARSKGAAANHSLLPVTASVAVPAEVLTLNVAALDPTAFGLKLISMAHFAPAFSVAPHA